MKTAIYIEDGVVQLVITPESDFEKNALTTFQEKPLDAKIFSGSFYDCRGGWVRQQDYNANIMANTTLIGRNEDKSLIIQIKDKAPSTIPTGVP